MKLQTELGFHIDTLENMSFRPQFHSLIIKIQAVKCALKDVFKNERRAYEQLMLAEIALNEMEPSPHAAKIADCIANAKGFLACVAFASVMVFDSIRGLTL